MGKKKSKKILPFVSICTPTFNRRPFFEYTIKCFLHQDYPVERMEWIIIDDGTDSFKIVNLEVFKLKKEKLFVLISITWYTDTLIPKVSYISEISIEIVLLLSIYFLVRTSNKLLPDVSK